MTRWKELPPEKAASDRPVYFGDPGRRADRLLYGFPRCQNTEAQG